MSSQVGRDAYEGVSVVFCADFEFRFVWEEKRRANKCVQFTFAFRVIYSVVILASAKNVVATC